MQRRLLLKLACAGLACLQVYVVPAAAQEVLASTLDDGPRAEVSIGAAVPTSGAGPQRSEPDADRLIVKYRSETSIGARRSLRSSVAAVRLESLPAAGAEVLRVGGAVDPVEAARRLSQDPRVVYAAPDVFRRPATEDPSYAQQWGLRNTGQTVGGQVGTAGVDSRAWTAWAAQQGSAATVVGVIDTGIDIDHPDLDDTIWTNPGESGARATNGLDDDGNGYVDDVHGWDFANDDASVFDVADGDSHGTHVAGTIAAEANNSIGGAGVAYGVQILPLKFLKPTGGWDSDAIEAIAYAKAKGVKIINASWGATRADDTDASSVALKAAIASCACVFIAAAGNASHNNDNGNGASYPATFDLPNIVSVAAMDNTGTLAGFSNYGATSVDVAAPGVAVLSTVPRLRAGVAAVHVATGPYVAQHWGFGLEDIAGAARRADMLSRAMTSLGTTVTDPVLLVADDALPNWPSQAGFYTAALTSLGYSDVTTLPVSAAGVGPSAATMAGKTVIWETGLAYGASDGSYGALRDSDHAALTEFLDAGGKLLLAGADALYKSETSTFVRERLHVTFLREESAQVTLTGVAAPYAGESYTASSAESTWGSSFGRSNPYRDVVEPRTAAAVPVLHYAGAPNYDSAYSYYNGTSMASPHVAGVAALIQSRFPTLPAAELADRLKVTAQPRASLAGKVATGGFIDAERAVSDTPSPPPSVGMRVVNGNLWVSWPASAAPFNQVGLGYEVQLVKGGVAVGSPTTFARPGEYAIRDVPGPGTYEARVRALGGTGSTMARQSTTSATMPAGSAPAPVTGLSVSYTRSSPVISWDTAQSNGSAILSYQVCHASGYCRTLTGSLSTPPSTSLTWDGPSGNVSVLAINSYGTGGASTAAVASHVLPGEPTNIVATAEDEAVTLRWQIGDGGQPAATSAIVTIAPGGRQLSADGTALRVTGLTNGVSYTFAIRARNAGGLGAAAVSAQVVPRDTTPPAAVTNLRLAAGVGRAAISWTNPLDPDLVGVSVRVLPGTVAPGLREGVQAEPTSGTTANVINLLDGQTYAVAIYPYDEAGNYGPATIAILQGSALNTPPIPRVLTFGSALNLETTLTRTDTAAALGNKEVQLWQRPSGSSTWSRVCSVATSSIGKAACATRPSRNTTYQWRFAGGSVQTGASSRSSAVSIRPRISAAFADATVTRGSNARISGSVAPAQAGQKVYLQRLGGRTWRTVAITSVSSRGNYGLEVRMGSRGASTYRVHTKADAHHDAGFSPTRRISVR